MYGSTSGWNGAKKEIHGQGNGPINAFVHAMGKEGWKNFRVLDYRSHAIGVGSAWGFSAVAMLTPQFFPQHHGAAPIYFESAAVIIVLVLLGQVLELRARARTGSAIKALLHLAPPTARRVRDGGDEELVNRG